MPDVTDMELVREYCARQSEPAFETLVHRHINLVYSTALRQVGNPAQAEEITQAVFIILARKAVRLRPDAILAAWLHEAARYVAASFLRGEIRRRRREQEAYMRSTLKPTSDDSAWEQLAPLLDEAIGRLGTADRNVVVLRYFQNKSAREIAAALNIGEAAAKKRLTRAVEKLRLDFLKRGINVSTAALSGSVLAHSIQAAPATLAKSVTGVALAKGAATSTSTLTLVKGALKIMAWSKAKTAVVAGAVILLAAASTTVIGIKMTRAHHALEKPSAALSPSMINVTADVEADGSLRAQATVVETNGTHQVIRTDRIDGEGGDITRITDESGRPMKFEKKVEGKGRFGYVINLDRPVPPGGQISYNFEENLTAKQIEAFGVIKTTAPDIREWRMTSYPSHAGDLREIWVLHLPPGATLLAKERGMTARTNAGQVELRLDKTIPPNGGYTVGFRYRLPANAN